MSEKNQTNGMDISETKNSTPLTTSTSENTYKPSSLDSVKVSEGYLEKLNGMSVSGAKLYNKFTNTTLADNIESNGIKIVRDCPVTFRSGDEVYYWNKNHDIDLMNSLFVVGFYFDENKSECFTLLLDGQSTKLTRKLTKNLLLVPGGQSNFNGIDNEVLKNMDVSKFIEELEETENMQEDSNVDKGTSNESKLESEGNEAELTGNENPKPVLSENDSDAEAQVGENDGSSDKKVAEVENATCEDGLKDNDEGKAPIEQQTELPSAKKGILDRPRRHHRAPEKLDLGDDYHHSGAKKETEKRKKSSKAKTNLGGSSKKNSPSLQQEGSLPDPSSSTASVSPEQLLASIDANFQKHFRALNGNLSRNINKWVKAAVTENPEASSEDILKCESKVEAASMKITQLEEENTKLSSEISKLEKEKADMILELNQSKDELASYKSKAQKLQDLNMKLQENTGDATIGNFSTPKIDRGRVWDSSPQYATGADFRYASSSEVIEMLPEDTFSPSEVHHSQNVHPQYLRQVTQPMREIAQPLHPHAKRIRGAPVYRYFTK